MKKFLILTFLLLTMAFSPVFNSERQYPVTVINKTDQPVTLNLYRGNPYTQWQLYVPSGETREYTLFGGVYAHFTFACGKETDGALLIFRQTRLTFTSCYSDAPNQGEPGMEKIHLYDSPYGNRWQYISRIKNTATPTITSTPTVTPIIVHEFTKTPTP